MIYFYKNGALFISPLSVYRFQYTFDGEPDRPKVDKQLILHTRLLITIIEQEQCN